MTMIFHKIIAGLNKSFCLVLHENMALTNALFCGIICSINIGGDCMSDENREYTKAEVQRLSSPSQVEARRRDLAINCKRLKSLKSKFENDEVTTSETQEFNDSMEFFKQVAEELDEENGDDAYKEKINQAWAYATYHFNPAFAPVYLINICVDLAGMMRDALALMIENMKPKPTPPKEQDPNEKFFGIKKQKQPKEKDLSQEPIQKGKTKRKDIEKVKLVDTSYHDVMKQQAEAESKKAKERGDNLAGKAETERAGIFSAKHGKGNAKESSWEMEENSFWGPSLN